MTWDLLTYVFWLCLLHHADIAPQTCLCGRDYTIFKRNDIFALEEAAKSFQQGKECVDKFSLSSIFSCNINDCIKVPEVSEMLNINRLRHFDGLAMTVINLKHIWHYFTLSSGCLFKGFYFFFFHFLN